MFWDNNKPLKQAKNPCSNAFFRDFYFYYAKSMLNSFTHAAQSLYLCGLWEKHKIYVKFAERLRCFSHFPLAVNDCRQRAACGRQQCRSYDCLRITASILAAPGDHIYRDQLQG